MTGRTPYVLLCMMLGFALDTRAEATLPHGTKPVKFNVKAVTQPDGSIVERLTPLSAPRPAAMRATVPSSPEAWLARMLDSTQNGLALKHPDLFVEWLDTVTEPHFMTALATVAQAPDSYPTALAKLMDPSTMRNWAEFIDPSLYLRWMAVGVDPKFYPAIFNRMASPEKNQRWAIAPTVVETYKPPTTAINPATYGQWFSSAMDARHYSPVVNADSPAASLGWLGAFSGEMGRVRVRQQSAEEWLQLPSQDPKNNPWLVNNQNYRY